MTDKKYLDLPDKVLLATILERLDNLVVHFEKHQDDDVKVSERVRILETKEARLDSRIILLSGCCTAIGFIAGKLPIHW